MLHERRTNCTAATGRKCERGGGNLVGLRERMGGPGEARGSQQGRGCAPSLEEAVKALLPQFSSQSPRDGPISVSFCGIWPKGANVIQDVQLVPGWYRGTRVGIPTG
eukprot:238580-Rhodomonas_salina.1